MTCMNIIFRKALIELKGYYIDGAMYGRWRKYTRDGHLFEEVTMINNEEMGPFREYHPNGKIQAEGTYLHGPNEDGRLKLYDESGQLQKEMVLLCRKVLYDLAERSSSILFLLVCFISYGLESAGR